MCVKFNYRVVMSRPAVATTTLVMRRNGHYEDTTVLLIISDLVLNTKLSLKFDNFWKWEKIVWNSLRCRIKTRRCVAKSQTVKVRAKRPNYLCFATLVSCDDPTINENEKISQICTLEKLEVEEWKILMFTYNLIWVLLRILTWDN